MNSRHRYIYSARNDAFTHVVSTASTAPNSSFQKDNKLCNLESGNCSKNESEVKNSACASLHSSTVASSVKMISEVDNMSSSTEALLAPVSPQCCCKVPNYLAVIYFLIILIMLLMSVIAWILFKPEEKGESEQCPEEKDCNDDFKGTDLDMEKNKKMTGILDPCWEEPRSCCSCLEKRFKAGPEDWDYYKAYKKPCICSCPPVSLPKPARCPKEKVLSLHPSTGHITTMGLTTVMGEVCNYFTNAGFESCSEYVIAPPGTLRPTCDKSVKTIPSNDFSTVIDPLKTVSVEATLASFKSPKPRNKKKYHTKTADKGSTVDGYTSGYYSTTAQGYL